MNILVTGGAGYIGSHMVRSLVRDRHHVVVVDNLSSGHRDAVDPEASFVQACISDRQAVGKVLTDHEVEAIFHFASRIQVGESVKNPRLYYRDNLAFAVELLEAALDAGVRHFILSSTAAVYGNPIRTPIDEEHPQVPINPYGETKLSLERMLFAYHRAYGLSCAALRYFNAAGADPEGASGERHEPETHLIPLVIDAALGKRPAITVYGDDYPTPDGTCIRDYIHVMDLASAHQKALAYLVGGGSSGAFNLGTGVGHSVKEVIDTVTKVGGKRVPVEYGPRRAGDPPELLASPGKAMRELAWQPTRSSLESIVRDAWAWHSRTPA